MIGFLNIGFTPLDTFRVVFICLALLLIGANLSFIIHARLVFRAESCNIWRIFFVAKSFITFALAYLIWQRVTEDQGFAWATWVGSLGIILSNASLYMLWRLRLSQSPYHRE